MPATTADDAADPVRDREADQWLDYDDAHYERVTIDGHVVELFYRECAGGQINIWTPGTQNLDHVWPPATIDGDDYYLDDSVHFMHSENATMEFERLADESDVTDLMWRNR